MKTKLTPLEQDILNALSAIISDLEASLERTEIRGAEYGSTNDNDGTKRHENAYKVGALTQTIRGTIGELGNQIKLIGRE